MQIQNNFFAIVQLVFCMSHDAGVGENGRKKRKSAMPSPSFINSWSISHIWEHELFSLNKGKIYEMMEILLKYPTLGADVFHVFM